MSVSEIPNAPSEPASRVPLSLNQEFLCIFDEGDDSGPFGPRYNIFYASRLRGKVHADTLRAALHDVAERHEALRTLIVRAPEDRHQRILPSGPVELTLRDLSGVAPADRDRRAGELVNEIEAGSYSATEVPLLRAVLARFDDEDAVLVLIAHHTAADAWSMHVIMRDLAHCYAARRARQVAALPEAPQYRDYTLWEQERSSSPALDRAREYWREKLRGAQILTLPTDHPRSAGLPKTTGWHRFTLGPELSAATRRTAKELRCSTFMVLFAANNILLNRITGVSDVVVPTFTTGRTQERFHTTVGSFFNFVPLRTNLDGCDSYREAVRRTRATCLEAYSHDIPFAQIAAEAPELMAPAAADDRALFLFQVFQSPFGMAGEVVGDVEYAEVPRLVSQPVGGDIPDGSLCELNLTPSGEIIGTLGFNTNLWRADTMAEWMAEFDSVLRAVVTTPDAPLR
ncbi:condensation domain-containing protein [Microbispora sp. H11081]|uniref:condensation domain-containing protein n=1 Tax=Microbispora sp. H11081 TaxID=2729107 RepID=UPI001B8B3942|nr:condensation domain-containing protein [Microbispora sp. H11081]